MDTTRGQASTTDSGGGRSDGPLYCCSICFCIIVLGFPLFIGVIIHLDNLDFGDKPCYIELFAHSVSLSNVTNAANVSTADWRTGLVAKSPVTRCKLSLHTVTSRLLRGDEVIAHASPSLDDFGVFVAFEKTDGPVTTVDFRNVVTPGADGSIFWDYRVESIVGLKAEYARGLLSVTCSGIPVKFTVDAAGNVVGSLLGEKLETKYVNLSNTASGDWSRGVWFVHAAPNTHFSLAQTCAWAFRNSSSSQMRYERMNSDNKCYLDSVGCCLTGSNPRK